MVLAAVTSSSVHDEPLTAPPGAPKRPQWPGAPSKWFPMGNRCKRKCSMLIVAILFGFLGVDASEPEVSPILASFLPRTNDSIDLSHVVVDPHSATIYAAGKNHLYQLRTTDLSVIADVRTGPRMDSPSCHASGCDSLDRGGSTPESVPTDNHNKILLVNQEAEELVVCGSVQQGACELYKLGNISVPPVFIPRSVAANDKEASTYAFIGPEKYNPWGSSSIMYVGTTFTNIGDYRHDVPAISSRHLYNMEYAEYTFSKQSFVRVDVKYRDHFVVKYVYGFNMTDFAYFVTVQKKSYLPGEEEKGYVSRLARTCISDANYDSYTEVTLECKVGRHNYNLVQAARVSRAGEALAARMGIEPGSYVLTAVFAPSQAHSWDRVPGKSAVCVYSMEHIQVKFTENIHMCFNGSMKYRNMGYISGPVLDGECPKAGTTGNILDFCQVGLKISGVTPITAEAVVAYTDATVTGVAVTTAEVSGHTVAFLGTNDGRLKKVLITSDVDATEYEELVVDPGYEIIPDLVFDPTGDYVYVTSRRQIFKIKVENCGKYTNCSGCLESRDPFCGWCSLEKRCTVRGACQNATQGSPRWLSFGVGQQCIDFEQILPDRIPFDQMATVQLTIRTLPALPEGAKYQCIFGGIDKEEIPVDANVTKRGLSCAIPPPEKRPPIPPNEDHVMVPLAVRSTETNKDFVSRHLAYYSCERHRTCLSCVKSQWACSWCLYENRCTANSSAQACPNRALITGLHVSILNFWQHNPSHMVNRGPQHCPRFATHPNGKDRLLLPNGVPSEIRLEVINLPQIPNVGARGGYGSGLLFHCLVTIEGAKMRVPARVETNRFVICERTTYSYEEPTGEYEAEVTVVWNENHYVDTKAMTLYKCDVLGSHREHPDCSLCVTRSPEYKCSWCGNQCVYADSCSQEAAFECPKPEIHVISPLNGPVEGGTLVTIEGSNLGLQRSDVDGKISIGRIPCKLVEYKVSNEIICRTGAALGELDAPIVVGNNAGYTQSEVKFSYRNVEVNGIFPMRGPQSGGTQVVIQGAHLNVGSLVSVSFDGLPCHVNTSQASSARITCRTSRSNGPRRVDTVTVTIDNAVRALKNPYNYTMDPTIMEIKPLKSFASGGRIITVHGTNLDAIQVPQMVVYMEDRQDPLNMTTCVVRSPSYMECPSPAVDLVGILSQRGVSRIARSKRRKRRMPEDDIVVLNNNPVMLALRIGFLMDDVASVQDLAKHFHNLRSQIIYVADPVFYPFSNNLKIYKGDTLVIEGENLNLASDESDVNVTIGTEQCNVTALASRQLICWPPMDPPSPTDENGVATGQKLPLVVVRVGQNLRFPLGYLHYSFGGRVGGPKSEQTQGPFPPEVLGAVAGGALLLIFGALVVLIVYRRKSSQAEREYKRIQIQMDTLESNVRSECKQAFAELQTDMTDLTADLESTGIPTLPHKAYVMKVFFPGVMDHPILNDPKISQMRLNGPRTNYDAAMVQFDQLINNKMFLLTFIDTLENQKSFTIRDKVNVASLLMVVLMGKLDYATDILRLLLSRLVERAASSRHPQLMLRRTESVVEKLLTNWLALCVAGYLREKAGASLFLLFKAIKRQVEKGPIDAITHDARYALSEEKLLREQFTHHAITIHLVQDDPHYEKIPYQTYQGMHGPPDETDEKIQCKALDCDTISQVKAKILDALYKNTPFSLRPSIHEVDLEWRPCGRSAPRILVDDDGAAPEEPGGWRKLNTLAYYGVADPALMALIPRQSPPTPCTATMKSCRNCSFAPYPTYPRSLSPAAFSNGHVNTGCYPVYHLVKPIDDLDHHGKGSGNHKAIPEIFLTRLLATKGTIQKYVDDFFTTILTVDESLPPAIKWLFDLLDEQARRNGITDPEVIHAWKSNSLPLRFWVNFIKNPDFIFDMNKTPTVDCCLSVIAQTFMDACSTSEHRLGKDSPPSKLLFAKDLPRYRRLVSKFYSDIASLPQVTDQELHQPLQQLSLQHGGDFDTLSALKELYIYVTKYSHQIIQALDTDIYCSKMLLAHKLKNVAFTMGEGEAIVC